MRPTPKIGVQGVVGSSIASGIGTIQCTIADDDNVKYVIQLEDVIYLPESTKNLISISKWADDKQDDCGVLSRGTYSIFLWDNDTKRNHITHPPNYPIPVMPVNEDEEAYAIFIQTHLAYFPDNTMLMPNGVIPPSVDDPVLINTTTEDTNADQQFVNVPSTGFAPSSFHKGSTV